jgi:hypothetical protein
MSGRADLPQGQRFSLMDVGNKEERASLPLTANGTTPCSLSMRPGEDAGSHMTVCARGGRGFAGNPAR